MWIEAILIGIIISFIRDGRLLNLNKVSFKSVYLIFIGLVLQILPNFINQNEFIIKNTREIILFGTILVMIFYVMNLNKKGFILISLGGMFNLIAVLTNSMRMPVVAASWGGKYLLDLKMNILSNNISNYVLYEQANHFTRFLGKVFAMPSFYPFTKVFGIGDLLIAAGVVVFIVSELTIHHKHSFRNRYTRRTRF